MPLDKPELISGGGVPDRLGFHRASAVVRQQLEAKTKARLFRQRQRIKAEMSSYKLPDLQVAGYEDDPRLERMQEVRDEEYLRKLMTPEYLEAAQAKIDQATSKTQAMVKKRQMEQGKKKAEASANKSMQKVAKGAQSAGKIGWDAENLIASADAFDLADFEIPTIINIFVQMYRATTALLNDGKKFMTGFLAFFEPPPLFRFWNPKDIERVGRESLQDPMFGGGTELENTVESLILGWPEAILGFFIVIIALSFLVTIITIIVVILALLTSV